MRHPLPQGIYVLILLILMTGCVTRQDSVVESTPPPATLPEVSEIDSIEVVFGDQTRVVTDRKRIEGFVAFVNSLDSNWEDISGHRPGPAEGWKIFVNSGGEENVAFAYFAGYLIWHVFPSPKEHIYRGRELNQGEFDRLASLLDLEADLETID